MRNALNPVYRYAVNVARTVEREWNAFWYTPADPTLLGLFRILTGLMLLYTHAVWGLALDDFFGPTSWLSPSLVRAIESQQYMYSFWLWVPDQWMWPAYALSMVVLVLFHARALDANHVGAGALRRDFVCQPRPGGVVRARSDQHHADPVPGDRAQRPVLSLDRWLARRRLGPRRALPRRACRPTWPSG